MALEEQERAKRSLERRVRNAKIGPFKPMCDFDWSWPKRIDRAAVEELFQFDFLSEAANVVLIGSNGLGKTTIAQNLAHAALLAGHTALFVSASVMLNDLVAQDGPSALARRLRRYVRPELLVIDEVGYLSYGTEHADLLFDIVNRRNHDRSTVVTTNKEFREWNEVFPNSASVVALVDRLVHRSEIVHLEGKSYRLKSRRPRSASRRAPRNARSASGGIARGGRRMNRRPPIPPHPDLDRAPPRSFGWLDARLLREEWLGLLGPEAVAVLALLALAADRRGASFYRRETMALALSMPRREMDRCLDRLLDLGLVAHRPWKPGLIDGVWQIMPVLPKRR